MEYIKKYKNYIISVIIALGVGALSALLSGGFDTYSSYEKPPLSPPAILFPIVWTLLYIAMGIAAAIVYESHDLLKGTALKLYALQLIVNFFWSIIFFRYEAVKFALFWLILLIIAVIATYRSFLSINKRAGNLLLPYIFWLIFAFYLNFGIIILNS